MSWVRIFHLWVNGPGFESFTFGGQWWCSAWSWVRIFDILGINDGVAHGRWFESLTFGESMVVHVVGSNLCLFGGHQWWCSAWYWGRIFVFWWINGCEVHGRGFEYLTFWGSMVV
jgi:hypothetical protein